MADIDAKVSEGIEKAESFLSKVPKPVLVIVGIAVVAFLVVMSGAFGS